VLLLSNSATLNNLFVVGDGVDMMMMMIDDVRAIPQSSNKWRAREGREN